MIKLAGRIVISVAPLLAAAGCSGGSAHTAASVAGSEHPAGALFSFATPTTVGQPESAKAGSSRPPATILRLPVSIPTSGTNPRLPPPPPSLPPPSASINPGREVQCSSLGLHGWEINQDSIHDCWTLYLGGNDLNAKIASYWVGIDPNDPSQGTISAVRPRADQTSETVDVPPPSASLNITKVNFDYVCAANGSSDLVELNVNTGKLQPQASDCH